MLRQGFNHIRIMKFQKVPQIETHKTSTHKKNHTKPQKKKKKNPKIKPLHTFELSLISNHTTMNCSILGSDDHRGSSSFHPSVEELFCFVQFYWTHCDRSSFSIYFLIKNNHFLGTSIGLRSSVERHIISRG